MTPSGPHDFRVDAATGGAPPAVGPASQPALSAITASAALIHFELGAMCFLCGRVTPDGRTRP